MCNFSGKLIAWLDHELTETEAIKIECHVRDCAECGCALGSYQQISGAFLACYETAMTAQPRRKRRLGTWAGVAAAAAILLAILLAQPRVESLSVNIPPPPSAPAIAYEKPVRPAPVMTVRLRHGTHPVLAQKPQWIAEEPTIEVALPADALFPPGAVPAGFSFIADVHPQP
jgi:hypothetical protein